MKKFFILLLFIFSLIKFSYADESYTVNIPTSNGAYKTIILTRSGDTYIGPQGEHYGHFPTVVELQAVYGAGSSTATAPVPAATLPSYTPLSADQRARMTDQQISDFNARMQQEAIERQADQNSMNQQAERNRLAQQQIQASMDAQTLKQQQQQQQIDQQIKVSEQKMDATQKQWKDDAKKEEDKVKWQAAHPFGIPTAAEAKKNVRDEFIANVFMWILLIFALCVLVFILLLHLPNKLIGPDHFVNDLPISIAIRKGMTKAQFNSNVSNILVWELIIISVLVGVGFHSILAFFICFFVSIILLGIKTSAFVLIYLLCVFWMMAAAMIGYLLCGGHFATMGNYVSAWIGGFIVAILGFSCAWTIHTSGLQYMQDIGS